MVLKNSCENFVVLPIESCYAIRWEDHYMFVEEKHLNATMTRLNNSIIAHVWNKFTKGVILDHNANVAYIHLAKKYCPKVHAVSPTF